MYRKIIVGYDGSERAEDGLALGKLIAEASGADLVVAGVFQFHPMWGGLDPNLQEAEADYARKIERAAESVGAEPEAIPSSSAGRGLHELAEEIGADLVVVGLTPQPGRTGARRQRRHGPSARVTLLGGDRPAWLRHGRRSASRGDRGSLRRLAPRRRWLSRTQSRSPAPARP